MLAALLCASCSPSQPSQDKFTRWARYEAEPGGTSFSALDQITRSNVNQLETAWTYPTSGAGDLNPIIIDSVMYVLGADNSIVALNAGTGEEIWIHSNDSPGSIRTHGFLYWENDDRSVRRVYYPKGSYDLVGVNALTGELASSFGDAGRVDLRQGLGDDPTLVTRATSPSPGTVFENLLILGSAPGEGYVASPGHIRAFDALTGELVWIFHTLPKPGEFGYDTWPPGRSDNGGGANNWGGMSLDDERGIVYIPLGSANYDFYGIDRHGENLFANSIVALDARTGERIWHFQTIHHDLWDYDLTATPILLTVDHEGESVDIVVLATKTGMVFAFNRETGEPIWPIEERPVPASEMPGEQAWPTQPFPTKPESFIPTTFDLETDINPYLVPADRDSLIEAVKNMRYEGLYTPPGTQPTLQVPGNRGGANWGSTSGDPRNGTFFVLSYNMPSVLHLEPIISTATGGTGSSPFDRGQAAYQENCQLCHGATLQGQPAGGIPSLIGVTDRLSHDELDDVILNGRNIMPGVPHLSERELNGLKMFLANPELALVPGELVSSGEVPNSEPVRYQSAWFHILDSQGVPVIKPPWFRLTAYDMNQGTIKWQVPVGDVSHLVEEGVTGTGSAVFLRGGPAITAGNLVFISTDDRFRALDSETGEELWSTPLPGAGEGIPAVYEVDGKQYVVVSASMGRRWSQQPAAATPREPQYIAFALPD